MFSSILALMGVLIIPIPLQTAAGIVNDAQENRVDDRWLLSYQGKNTNQVRWDNRLLKLLETGLPHVHAPFYDVHKPLPEVALITLSGPPEPVSIESNRYVTLAACVPHVGELKGLLWVDTGNSEPAMIFAALDQDSWKTSQSSLALYTRHSQFAEKLPPQFISPLTKWLSDKGIRKITEFTITNAEGKTTNLPLTALGF